MTIDDSDLWTRYDQTRDAATREEIILRYVPLVHYVMGRLAIERSSDYDDLASQGLLGLIDAVDKFDPARGIQFSTYATHRIRGRVLDGLRAMDILSRPARQRVRKIQSAMTHLQQELGRAPEETELAQFMSLNIEDLRKAMTDAGRVLLSLDETSEDDANDLHDVVSDDADDPEAVLSEANLKTELIDSLATLPPREQHILSLYYRDDLTMKEIGAVLDISESRVCQLHAKAILSLRAAMERAGQAVEMAK